MRNKGITLIEILIGITVSSIIFIVSSSLVASLFYAETRSKDSEALEQTKNDLQSEFYEKIKWGENINVLSDRLIVDDVEYSLSGGRLLKDGSALTAQKVNVQSFSIKDYSLSPDEVSLEITFELENKEKSSTKDSLKIIISQRKLEFTDSND
jgi:type II secretory pathway pseudopilin PulG